MPLRSRRKQRLIPLRQTKNEDKSKDGYSKTDFSIPVGISYEYMNVVIDARYNLGLSKVHKDLLDQLELKELLEQQVHKVKGDHKDLLDQQVLLDLKDQQDHKVFKVFKVLEVLQDQQDQPVQELQLLIV